MHALQQMVLHVTVHTDTLHHLVDDGALAHAVDTAQDIYPAVEIPDNVLLTTPKGVDLYLLNIIRVLHTPNVFLAQI